ncbi:hypothetical protein DMC63_40615 [Streptomyces sp. WAC 05977]|nr:hypothetical protein DMC63_40615 [Streptomyces sp. WAC 05977]
MFMSTEFAERSAEQLMLQPGVGAPSAVRRYWHPTDKDWLSVPAHGNQPTAAQLASYGYQTPTAPQFYVSLIGGGDMVEVFRWWHAADKDWIDMPAGMATDAQMTSWGYQNKTFQYYALPTQRPGTVPVHRWWHPADKDWLTVRAGEFTDAQLQSFGYQNKTFLFYAFAQQSPTQDASYFPLGTPQKSVLSPVSWSGEHDHPHTFSVLDVNPAQSPSINGGFRFLGYFGHHECAGLGIARTNDLNTTAWTQSTTPLFAGTGERWGCALLNPDSTIGLVHNVYWCGGNPDGGAYYIVGRKSTDGVNGTQFTSFVPLVKEMAVNNGNPTLFRDPATQTVYLYWFREAGSRKEIRVRSATSFDELLQTDPADLGTLVAYSRDVVAAPHVIKVDSLYYLAVETLEQSNVWKTRVLTATSPTGQFFETPAGPVYGNGSACVFQHVFDNTLHSYYCNEGSPGVGNWTLDHVSAPLP